MNAQSLFLELLSAAIWNRPVKTDMFHEVSAETWTEISNIAKKQSVIALVADKAVSLPQNVLPPRRLYLEFAAQIEIVKKANQEINDGLTHISAVYKELDTPFILLKGQGNALNYPNPALRSLGDLDLFLYRKGDYQKANTWAKNNGYELEPENIHHQAYNIGKIHIENHLYVTYFGIKKYDENVRKITNQITENKTFEYADINGIQMKLLPAEFNAFFIFQHMFHHFVQMGVGFRQLCDWILFLAKNKERINKDSFTALATSFDLLRPMQLFAKTAIKYLDASAEIFPFELPTDNRYVDLIMDDIFQSGNFGFYVFENTGTKWNSKWNRFVYSTKRTFKISPISPRHIRFLPINKIITNGKLLIKNAVNNSKS